MCDSLAVLVLVSEVRQRHALRKCIGAQLVLQEVSKATPRRNGLVCGHDEFDSVASREEHRLFDLIVLREPVQRRHWIAHREALPHIDRSGAVVHSEEQDPRAKGLVPTFSICTRVVGRGGAEPPERGNSMELAMARRVVWIPA
jgi:hypothetical protein